MNFELSKEHEMAQKMFRAFAQKEIKPFAERTDEEERFPIENVEKMAKYGFFGLAFPTKYGGQGGDNLAYAMAIEELSKVCATTGVILSVTTLSANCIYEKGTEEQKMKYLPDMFSGKKIGAFALTEPSAGTDASGQKTTAVREGDHYVLNGTKVFITNGGYAEIYIVMAMTDKSKGNHGISAFIVEKSFPGFKIGKKERKMGIRGSSTTEIILDNCIVPAENLLGKEGSGFTGALKALSSGRIGIASQCLGIAQGALDEGMKYVKERRQFGKRLSQFQNTQFKIAEMHTQVEAARYLVYRAACEKDAGRDYTMAASMAKLNASQAANDVTRTVVQLFGGYGYTRDYPVERMMRDAKITEIYEGTSEVQKMVISGQLKIN